MNQRTSRRSPSPRYGFKTPKKQDGFLHLLLFYILPFLVFNGLLFFFMTTQLCPAAQKHCHNSGICRAGTGGS